jgi:hypothetical protein
MLIIAATMAFLLVSGVIAYLYYLTPNPQDPRD